MDNRSQRHTFGRVLFRYVSGRPLDGYRRTNSNFLHAGTQSINQTGMPSRWELLPGWKRAAWRVLPPVAAVSGVISYLAYPIITSVVSALAVAGCAVYGGRRGYRVAKDWHHHRTYVMPLHYTLARVFDHLPSSAPDYLEVPAGFHDMDAPTIRVTLPRGLHCAPDVKRTVQDIVSGKLGLADFTAQWHTVGLRTAVSFHRLPRPPAMVTWDTARSAIAAAPDSAPVIGLGAGGRPVSVDLDAESPHILISAGTGGGKSVAIRAILAQGLNRGAHAIILDTKRHSHTWAKGLNQITYCRDIEEIHEALVAVAAEGERRNRATDDAAEGTELPPRLFLVAEEMNATINRLKKYWTDVRGKDDPKRSPAVDALGDILYMGRAVRIHVLAVAQMMTAAALGGPEARENFATRIMARYTVNAWKMLVPEVTPIPRASRHRGRVQVVIGGEATETQVVFLADAEAIDLVREGGHDHEVSQVGRIRPQVAEQVKRPMTPLPVIGRVIGRPGGLHLVDEPGEELIGLARAVEAGVLTCSLGAARQASARPGFPAVVEVGARNEKLYRVDDLRAWEGVRQTA